MSLSNAQIGQLARLARIRLEDSEIDGIRHRLDELLRLIDQMQAIDTTGVEAMSHPQEFATPMRADEVTAANLRDAYQRIAPQTEGGLYLVPKVIE